MTDRQPRTNDPSRSDPLAPLRGVSAPTELQRSVAALAATRAERAQARSLRPLLVAGALAALAIAALAIGLTQHSGTGERPTSPTVLQAASLGLRPATLPAPGISSRDAALLDRSAAGIAFPNWGPRLGWRASGARSDRLAGRTVATVFYRPAAASGADSQATSANPGATTDAAGYRVGYAIVAGHALPLPGGATQTSHGIAFHVLTADGANVLTWRRAGHTCILVARDVSSATLIRLATWQ